MRYTEEEQHKIKFEGRVVSVQVRSTVWRYLTDNRTHREIGYNIFIDGMVYDDMSPEEDLSDYCVPRKGFDAKFNFSVAISEKQMQKFHFHIGDLINGTAWTEKYPECEYADFYRAGALKKVQSEDQCPIGGPPWMEEVTNLKTYAWRGARMLDTRCYKGKCFQCKWAAMSNVTIEYNWGVTQKFRFESFCYGPKICPFYRMGRPRAVPYKGMGSAYDEGWLDEICTENRDDEE